MSPLSKVKKYLAKIPKNDDVDSDAFSSVEFRKATGLPAGAANKKLDLMVDEGLLERGRFRRPNKFGISQSVCAYRIAEKK